MAHSTPREFADGPPLPTASTRPLPTAAEEDAPGPRGRGKGTGKANKKQKPTKEEEYSGRLGGAYQATIPERETMPGSRREAASTPASSAAEAAPCTQIWAAVKPTAAGEHSKQEKKEKEMLTMFASCLVDHFKGRIPADRVGETRAVKGGIL
ncbi:hypothetical protein Esi_0005_0185 [Ectocarpus siliculosus]|uniref:Uncharacterized protein n=1 Tax=Ectocarpus siliculosus TaxID=2880 RepID=D8LNT4_ECTSI|nr:hypothetical protein Esi_0005_0185 [Ectocarpus siliculosus]|eukprot:CBN78294.1 hypothetical protein Esi_0005_0185 [Ectocarpus siliculosus]